MRRMEEYRRILENTVGKFGEPWKALPIEMVIKFVSDYEVISSDTVNDTKVLKLIKKNKV